MCSFKQLITSRYLVSDEKTGAEVSETLSYQETNGLRYAAGFVPRSLQKKWINQYILSKRSSDMIEETDYVYIWMIHKTGLMK